MNFEVPSEAHLHWNENEYNEGKKSVMKTIIILSIVTVIEVGAAMVYDKIYPTGGGPKMWLNLFMAVYWGVEGGGIIGVFFYLETQKRCV